MNQYDYIEAGMRVFGLCATHDDKGELDEKEKYKKPIASNWQFTPDWSDDQLDVMEEMGHFNTGFGVLVNGYLVVDVDARNGGVKSFNKLCKDLKIDLLGECGFAVASGSGNGSMHLYFKLDQTIALRQHHDSYEGIDFKSSGFVVGAGSMHLSGSAYEELHGCPDDISTPPSALIELLKRPEYHRVEYDGSTMDITDQDIIEMLTYYDNDDLDYDQWIECGMAIHNATDGGGFDIWLDWSSKSSKHDPSLMHKKWHSFGKSPRPVTIGTIIYHAKLGGWQSSADNVVFTTELEDDDNPLDIAGVDIKRPPGFVGELCEWINSQSFYPRESLAVAASLQAVSSISGMRYTDALNGFTPNLYMLCVAGSSTGKESIQQSYAECLAVAGVAGAMHGAIKSEQEMIRNLMAHQASFYLIDEFGIFLKKLINASSKSGASYLEGVIGFAMSAFSKANAYLPISGDLKESTKSDLIKSIAALQKKVDANEGDFVDEIKCMTERLKDIERGIKNPYVTLLGFTTPVTFNDLITYEMATNGFISRAMIFEEHETNPRPNKRFKKSTMPNHIKNTLMTLYSNGNCDSMSARVELSGDKVEVDTTEGGINALAAVSDAFWHMAEDAKKQGLEAIPRRGYEMVSKISLVLAIPSKMRTTEHVRWAYALVKKDIERKMSMAFSNINEKDDPVNAIAERIRNILDSHEQPMLKSVLINKCRPLKRDAVEKVIKTLIDKNKLKEDKNKKGAIVVSLA